jgi:hypothetical protein
MDTKLKISFDFDCTLSEHHIQLIAHAMVLSGHEVWIVTARCDDRKQNPDLSHEASVNRDLFRVAKKLQIPTNRIIMTEGAFKWRMIDNLDIDLHFDDVPEEVELISRNSKRAKAVLIWDEYSSTSIKHDSFGKSIF